jgi:uncharacterized protein (DUF885 family)
MKTRPPRPPDEVHELGLREVARIEGEMRTILDANGFAGQPIGEAMDKLAKDRVFFIRTMTRTRRRFGKVCGVDQAGDRAFVERTFSHSTRED